LTEVKPSHDERNFASPANLVVRVPNWIGDAVMALPALMDLRDCFPLAKITILAKPTIAELLNRHPAVDDVIIFSQEGKSVWGCWNLVRRVKQKRFDQAVLFQNAFEAAFIAWAAGIPSRIGYATDGRSGLLSKSIPRPTRVLHQTQYYQRLVSEITRFSGKERMPRLFPAPEGAQACARRFPELAFPSDSIVIGINPGSVYGSAKRWMPERFAEAGDKLVERVGISRARCVLIGGKGEEKLGQHIAEMMRYPPIVLSGKTTIQEMMGVLSHCAVLLTNDTGPMHVAQALGVPVAAIFGSTDPDVTGPVGQAQGILRSSVRCAPCFLRACPIDHRCMTGISVEQVVERGWSQIRRSIAPAKERLSGHRE
jgi:heptosyltransferase-2